MILSEKNAQPIIELLVENAVEQIKEKTGLEYFDKQIIFDELSDYDWLFVFNTDPEINDIDMINLIKRLDIIIERNIKWTLDEINDEREAKENVNF